MNYIQDVNPIARQEMAEFQVWTRNNPIPGTPLGIFIDDVFIYLIRPRPGMRIRNIFTANAYVIQSSWLGVRTLTIKQEALEGDETSSANALAVMSVVIGNEWIVAGPPG